MIGTTLGKYEVREEIGRGGMAVVYRGWDPELEREVAIKVLHPHLSSLPESKRRFHREARAVARLRAPNILEIFDYSGKDSEQAYIVTEFIHGTTLKEYCDRHGEMPTEAAALLALEVCRGLLHAHQHKVIHRDIKPENIMIREDGAVKITDFGIAQMAGTTQMTMTGQILGSPAYMSPEHVENKPLDFRADIFSMGTLLYWLTTRRLPFEGRNPHAVIKRIVEGDYVDPMRIAPAMGDQMAGVIRRCLEVNPDDRFPAVEDLISALEAFLRDVDVQPTGRELREYLHDPAAYTQTLRPRLLATLIRRGKEERKEKNLGLALQYFNRVLSIDEANNEVLVIVESMSSQRRIRRTLELAAVVATLLVVGIGIAVGIWKRVKEWGGREDAVVSARDRAGPGEARPPSTPRPRGPRVKMSVSAVPAAGDRAPGATEPAADPRRGDDGAPRDGKRVVTSDTPPVGPGGARRVRIVPDPPAARVIIDDVDHGEYGRSHVPGFELKIGSHTARLVPRDEFYEELSFTFTVRQDAPAGEVISFSRSLPLRPARVRVNCAATGATVSIPHRERSGANHAFQVRMNAREERVQMIIDAEGFRSEVLEVVLRAGQEYSLDVVLEPETQADGLATRAAP
jgi:serine/threonine-protein kinase